MVIVKQLLHEKRRRECHFITRIGKRRYKRFEDWCEERKVKHINEN
jgi:hypothetical protein